MEEKLLYSKNILWKYYVKAIDLVTKLEYSKYIRMRKEEQSAIHTQLIHLTREYVRSMYLSEESEQQ